MTELCGLCGGQLDDHGIRATITFAAGLRNGNHFLEIPHQLADWPLCWACFTSEACKVLREALADEYMEPVIERPPTACTAVCVGGRMAGMGRWRRLFAIRQGSIGVPPHGKCPVCGGAVEAEIAGERSALWAGQETLAGTAEPIFLQRGRGPRPGRVRSPTGKSPRGDSNGT
jgi:hypothetical protein